MGSTVEMELPMAYPSSSVSESSPWRFLRLFSRKKPAKEVSHTYRDPAMMRANNNDMNTMNAKRARFGIEIEVEIEVVVECTQHMRLLHEVERRRGPELELEAGLVRVRSIRAMQATCRNCARRYMCALSPMTHAAHFCSLDCQSTFRYLAELRAHIGRYVATSATSSSGLESASASTASLTMPDEEDENDDEYEDEEDQEDGHRRR